MYHFQSLKKKLHKNNLRSFNEKILSLSLISLYNIVLSLLFKKKNVKLLIKKKIIINILADTSLLSKKIKINVIDVFV